MRSTYLKKLLMDEDQLKKLGNYYTIEDFIEFIKPFYPDLNIKEYTIENIELALYDFFIKVNGKIISFSPLNMRNFLKDYLLKYEIMNIKQIILGFIVNMSHEEILRNVNFLVEEYLEKTDFIKDLIEIPTLEQIQLYMKGTRYYKAIREGLLYFKNYNEVFVLESFLDQQYYLNLVNREGSYDQNEKRIISLFDSFITEIYNINLIYRGIKNNIDKNLLSQFLINKYFFFNDKKMEFLLTRESLEDFFSYINDTLGRITDLEGLQILESDRPMWKLERIYKDYFFSKSRYQIQDIDDLTIFRILELIIRKELEIKYEIIPNVVRIIHEKFRVLE
ncbi:MAG: V-type ATPase subunit [Promethearchaeota archaeon]